MYKRNEKMCIGFKYAAKTTNNDFRAVICLLSLYTFGAAVAYMSSSWWILYVRMHASISFAGNQRPCCFYCCCCYIANALRPYNDWFLFTNVWRDLFFAHSRKISSSHWNVSNKYGSIEHAVDDGNNPIPFLNVTYVSLGSYFSCFFFIRSILHFVFSGFLVTFLLSALLDSNWL